MKPERTKEKYTFYKSNRDGEADVFYNGHALKTLPECNDEAARKIGYKDMDEVFSLLGNHSIKDARHSQLFVVLSEAAELYASQFREPSTEQSGMQLIKQERQRQIEKEGWSAEHDDTHSSGELGRAGSCYEQQAESSGENVKCPHNWPWEESWWKPKDYLSNMVRAGALYLAESDLQKRLGDEIKKEFWQSRAEIVANEIDRWNKHKDKYTKSTEQSGGTEPEEKILESHFGSDFYQLKEHRFLPHIISAMKEHAGIVAEQAFLAGRSKTSWSQFKKDMNHTRKP